MTPRLLAIAGMVPPCDTFYDIGSDHGKLPAFLLREGRCRAAVACDISPDALAKARRLFGHCGFGERARVHLGDGLRGIEPGPQDCVAVCGMGSRTILSIVKENIACPLVLSTHVAPEEIRAALPGRDYAIRREILIREERRFYVAMLVTQGEDAPYGGADRYIGRKLRGDPLLADYLSWKEKIARDILQARGPRDEAGWQDKLRWIQEAQKW